MKLFGHRSIVQQVSLSVRHWIESLGGQIQTVSVVSSTKSEQENRRQRNAHLEFQRTLGRGGVVSSNCGHNLEHIEGDTYTSNSPGNNYDLRTLWLIKQCDQCSKVTKTLVYTERHNKDGSIVHDSISTGAPSRFGT